MGARRVVGGELVVILWSMFMSDGHSFVQGEPKGVVLNMESEDIQTTCADSWLCFFVGIYSFDL